MAKKAVKKAVKKVLDKTELDEKLIAEYKENKTLIDSILCYVKCYGGSTGSIEVTATGGTLIPGIPGTYEYVLLDENDNVISAVINNPSADFSGLTVGIYKIEVTDFIISKASETSFDHFCIATK